MHDGSYKFSDRSLQMSVVTLLWGFGSTALETKVVICCIFVCRTAVTIATGPLQPYGTGRTGPMVNPQACAVV